MISPMAVATCRPTMNARYGDSGEDTFRSLAQLPPTRAGIRTLWPRLDIGKSSVTPWMNPTTVASANVRCDTWSPSAIGRQTAPRMQADQRRTAPRPDSRVVRAHGAAELSQHGGARYTGFTNSSCDAAGGRNSQTLGAYFLPGTFGVSLAAGRRPIFEPSQTSGSYLRPATRSFIGIRALSVILMCSGQTSVQHLVMLQ